MDPLSHRLDELTTSPRRAGSRRRPAPAPRRSKRLEEVLGGARRRAGATPYWAVETPFTDVDRQHRVRRSDLAGPLCVDFANSNDLIINPKRALVIDIETGGFSGTPVFLIGVVPLGAWPPRAYQWLARDYPEEEAILERLATFARRRTHWVSFNGKSFDVPFLADRAVVNRVSLDSPTVHVDLLHAARRRWRDQLADCRLQTLESEILGRRRVGDVSGADIPDLFHHFVRTGNAAPLAPVLEHNRLDLLTSTELLLQLAKPASR